MADNMQIVNVETLSYEEYCVYDILKSDGITIRGQRLEEDLSIDYDLYASDGIPSLSLRGKTLIEVKGQLSYSTIKKIGAFHETIAAEYNIVVVYFKRTVTNYPELGTNAQGKSLLYISYDELIAKYKKKKGKKKEDYYAERAKKVEWKEERTDIIRKAQEVVAQGNNVLFLGAGVGISAKMPSWNDLLKGLMGEVKQLKEPTLEAFKELSSHVLDECGNSYLIMARYLQTAIRLHDNQAEFSKLIQKYLYNKNNTSALLKTLAQIIQQKKVSEVITYNFDNLLEQNLAGMGLTESVDFTAISKDAEINGHNTMPIYHVHGIIPQNGPVDTVVFSEEEYHSRYSNAFHWSNIEQLHALSRMHCFFVGLSMTDPNLRRLLDTAQKINKSNGDCHYAFLRRTKMDRYCVSDIERSCKYVHVSESLIDKKKQKEIYDLNYSVIESIFMELGVRVIWYEEYGELPELVAQVFGLSTYQYASNRDLVDICEVKIAEIQKIEKGMQIFNKKSLSDKDVADFWVYSAQNGTTYRELIHEVGDILNELSGRFSLVDIAHPASGVDLYAFQKQVSKFDDNISGYGQFFKVWLDAVKICLDENL